MTRLGLRVADFVRANPGLTLEEIARGVHSRTQAVLEVLHGEGFSASLRMSYPSDRAKVYSVVSVDGDGRGTVARPSQGTRVAQLLSDGRWYTASEIHRRCGTMRLNSRIAELRKTRNWDIVCEHIAGEKMGPNAFRYRLVGTSDGDEARAAGPPAPAALTNGAVRSSSPSGASAGLPGASDSDGQLSLSEAA